ncbi:MAG: outer membrane protein assembly factor BamE [Burkholderiaceae bacterium]
MNSRRCALVVAASLAGLATGACQSLQSSDNFLGVITPYRVEVVQGNVITKERAALVKPGMSPSQVRDLLGTPLLIDIFHADRWDYVFTIQRQGAEPQLRRVVALFSADKLERLDAEGELPSEREFVGAIDTFKTSRDAAPLALSPAQLQALPVPAKVPAAPVEPAAALRDYPPLEPRP